MKIKISIIIPVYNVEKYIEHCLKSIACQLNEKIEVVLVNDGTTDNSIEICEKYCEEFQNINLYSQDNQGVSAARNYGIENARGEYLLFLDSDDWLREQILSEILLLLENNDAELVLGKQDIYLEKKSKYLESQEDYVVLMEYETPEAVFEHLSRKNPFWLTPGHVVVKREFLLNNNLFFYNGIRHEDELWVPLVFFYSKKIAILDKSIYCYRVGREDSFTKTKSIQHEFDKILIMDEFDKIIKRENAKIEKLRLLKVRSAVLEWGLIQDVRFYKNDLCVNELKNQIRKRIKYMNYGTYRCRFWACKILGIDNIRIINLWRISVIQYLKKFSCKSK